MTFVRLAERGDFFNEIFKHRNFVGHKFWARGYFVSIVGANEEVIGKYVQNQESDNKKTYQFHLFNR